MLPAKFYVNQSSGLRGDQKINFCRLKMADGLQHVVLMLSTRRNHRIINLLIFILRDKGRNTNVVQKRVVQDNK